MFTKTIATAAVATALVLSGCGMTGPAHTDSPPPAVDHIVDMGLASFVPETIRINEGQTVQWRNTAPISHTVTADPELAADPANVQLPGGAETFHSGEIEAGQVWQHTFTTPGTYRYVCLPHEEQGMLGTVVVVPQ